MVDVKVVRPTDRIVDRRYLMVVHGNHAMIVDADHGTTRIVPLDPRSSPTDAQPSDAVLQSAARLAQLEKIPVIYLVDYTQLRPGDPIRLPE
jgi:hypothetical protein